MAPWRVGCQQVDGEILVITEVRANLTMASLWSFFMNWMLAGGHADPHQLSQQGNPDTGRPGGRLFCVRFQGVFENVGCSAFLLVVWVGGLDSFGLVFWGVPILSQQELQ